MARFPDSEGGELGLRHEPAAANCRVAWRTDPTPALPLITTRHNRPLLDPIRAAVAAATDAVDDAVARALVIDGFVPRDDDDYQLIAERWNAATAAEVGVLL